jgi:hypothetical protein
LPSAPPTLSPTSARVLVRVLVKVGRTRGIDAILEAADREALAS